jgi:hypothetical protein
MSLPLPKVFAFQCGRTFPRAFGALALFPGAIQRAVEAAITLEYALNASFTSVFNSAE